MRKITIAAACICLIAGCSFLQFNEGAQKAAGTTVVIAKSLDAAEPVVVEFEKQAGAFVTEGQKSTAANVTSKVQATTGVLAGIAAVIPGGQGVAALLGGIGTIAGAVGTFFARRKTRKVAKAAVLAADSLPGGGKAITTAAIRTGTVNEVQDALKEVRAT